MKRSLCVLPFVRMEEEYQDLWAVTPTDDWSEDNKTGRRYADLFMDEHNPSLLPHIVRRMVEKQQFGGIETGFMHRIAERAMNSHALGIADADSEAVLHDLPNAFRQLVDIVS